MCSVLYKYASSYGGIREIAGPVHNEGIVAMLRRWAPWIRTDEDAWCAAFIAHCCAAIGIKLPLTDVGRIRAASYMDVGAKVYHKGVMGKLPAAEDDRNMIAVVKRKDGGYHVTIWGGYGMKYVNGEYVVDNGTMVGLGGNQSNRVGLDRYSVDEVVCVCAV